MNVTYDYGEPYDPDMTVQEALSKGLIAVIDSGTIGPGYVEPCDYAGPWSGDGSHVRCTRIKGHEGVHAFVVRWHQSYADAERARAELDRLAQEAKRDKINQEQYFDRLKKSAKEAGSRIEKMREAMASAAESLEEFDLKVKAQMADEDKWLNRIASQSYSPMEGHRKNARFRDKGAGKVRGR